MEMETDIEARVNERYPPIKDEWGCWRIRSERNKLRDEYRLKLLADEQAKKNSIQPDTWQEGETMGSNIC